MRKVAAWFLIPLTILLLSEVFPDNVVLKGGGFVGGASRVLLEISTSLILPRPPSLKLPRDSDCNDVIRRLLRFGKKEKFLWYAPHSGFGNQLVAFRNAIRMAGILNRTLIIPPVLEHNEFGLGDCSKRRATEPRRLRYWYWASLLRKMNSSLYVSMADVMDIANVQRDVVRTLDVRLFLALRCGLDVSPSLSACAWCSTLERHLARRRAAFWRRRGLSTNAMAVQSCEAYLGLRRDESTRCHSVTQSCNDVVFMYERDPATGRLLSAFEPLKTKDATCREGKPTYSNRLAVARSLAQRTSFDSARSAARPPPSAPPSASSASSASSSESANSSSVADVAIDAEVAAVNVVEAFGRAGSREEAADVLLFGSAFYYFDFSVPTGDSRADRAICASEFLRFSPPIMHAAATYTRLLFPNSSFACLHFRGGDMFYITMQDETLNATKRELALLAKENDIGNRSKAPLFLMTDLRTPAWHKTFVAAYRPLGFEVKRPMKMVKLLEQRVKLMSLKSGIGVVTNRITARDRGVLRKASGLFVAPSDHDLQEHFANVGVLLEQAVCACADLGFVGTHLSSVTRSINHLRNGRVCAREM